jgi:hypothetical protein
MYFAEVEQADAESTHGWRKSKVHNHMLGEEVL